MCTFKEDLFTIFNNTHNEYIEKYNELSLNNSLFENLNIDEAELLIKFIKNYKEHTSNIINTFDQINNIKGSLLKNELIDNEIQKKMLPIMMIYRTLLNENYKITDND